MHNNASQKPKTGSSVPNTHTHTHKILYINITYEMHQQMSVNIF